MFVCFSPKLGKVSPANVKPLILSDSRLTRTEASPGTSGENRAECRDTKSLSSWSKLHSIRFVSHDRIPVEEKEESWQASREAFLSLESIPTKVSRAFFWRSLHGGTQGGRTDGGAEVLPFVKRKCMAARG